MIRNYLKMAWRNLMRYRFISFINLMGLTLGLTCCLLITVYILHETSYDKYNKNANRIYRVTRSFNDPNGVVSLRLGTIAPPFGPLIKNYFPDIQKITRMLPNGKTPVRYEEKMFNENNVFFADENLFDVFSVNVLKGNPQKALADPFTVMVTEDMAKKYFGTKDPMNKMIRINNQFNLKVTGIFRPFPSNAHIHPEMMVSFNTLKDSAVYGERNLQTNYGNNSFFTFLLLPDNYPAKNIEAQFPAFLDNSVHFPGAPATLKTSATTKLGLQKLTDIHLRSHLDYEAEENGDITRVYIFSAIALIILLIACINYMNLSTARSTLRAKEIGIRKVAGATKTELIAQFLSESVLISWLSMLLAFGFTWLALPWLNTLSGLQLSVNFLLNWKIIVSILSVPFIVGIVSGLYPALFMSSFQPVKTLKGLFRVGGRSISFRQTLVVVQFAISIVLIITTAIVFQQLHYMQQKSLGYNKEHVLVMPYNIATVSQYESFRNDLLANPDIKMVGRSSRIPTGRLLDSQGASVVEADSLQPVNTELKYLAIDHDFIPTYGIPMAAGRNYSRDFATDTSNFVINEATVQVLGWKTPEKAIGKDLVYGGLRGKVIGVVQDFHFESLRQKIVPIVFTLPKPEQNFYGRVSVKIGGTNINSALQTVENAWKKFIPEAPYEFTFLDDNYQKLYQSEQRQGSLFTIFSCIAIFIACLGLLGLSAFAISQRVKEIGIRKVLGASSGSIVSLFSKDFLKLVAIAALIAFPVAWYAMHKWLADFAYRIPISWWVFLVAGMVSACVALLTVSIQAMRAAMSNPVKSLRTE
ncbi:MAG: FtsX-like permease family protein [Sediminibacterium sp.]|nr:FtsX-like permease family protein [Sediminibacterium sp.]